MTPKKTKVLSRKSLKTDAQLNRETILNEAKRAYILHIARETFFELGLDGTSLREIAKRSGYTPGAIYSYFTSREDIYGTLLSESLTELRHQVTSNKLAAKPTKKELYQLLMDQAMSFFMFYFEKPQDLDLGFYLFNGSQPKGLTSELNTKLNTQLKNCLEPIEKTLVALGLSKKEANEQTTAIFAHAVGLLILNNTGRIKLFKQNAKSLFKKYLENIIQTGL